jgi:uroporphyrinogen decarboxylase
MLPHFFYGHSQKTRGDLMSSRQRIRAALSGEKSDRLPLTEIGIWPETLARWRGEGLPSGVSPHDYLDMDKIEFFSFDTSLGLEESILREDATSKTYRDGDGCTYRMLKETQGAPELMSSSIQSIDDWTRLRENLRPAMPRFNDFRKDIVFGGPVAESQTSKYKRCAAEDAFTALVPVEPCWYYLRLLGEEESLAQIALDPDFAGAIIHDYNQFTLSMVEQILRQGYRFDALWVFSDLCYKNGMLFSPRFYEERVFPHQRRLFDLARENGMKVIYHSDGNIEQLLPRLIKAGVDCIQPLEARAGNDLAACVQKHGKAVSYMGNINMDVFTTAKEKIEEEVTRKITAGKATGRYIFHSDHSVPYTVSLENYAYALSVAHSLARY